jgi:hypothetical protein
MPFYQKQMFWISIFLLFFMFLGLVIISFNMGKITLRDEQDFIFITAQGKEWWEVRFLGLTLEINKKVIREQLQSLSSQIEQYVARGSSSLKKLKVYWQKQLVRERE